MGKPRVFKSDEDFIEKVQEYFDYCYERERFVNIAGLCVYLGIGRTTFYDQKQHYPNAYETVNEMLEDETLNNSNIETPVKVLYLKNKCGYMDKIETKNENTNVNKNIDLSILTDEQLDKILKSE